TTFGSDVVKLYSSKSVCERDQRDQSINCVLEIPNIVPAHQAVSKPGAETIV
ncbi:hypothetical protein COCVIDRAFT_107259, partial [Bipolaris victoriae FI3]